MSDRTRDAKPASRPTTILDPLRPAVVVRRRVYDAASSRNEAEAARAFISTTEPPVMSQVEDDDDDFEEDDNGPPSSINVARAIASLRADELARVEALVRADEEAEEAEAALHAPVGAPPAPAVPTVVIGKTIALSELADHLGVPANELPATLVARGFYAMTAKTVLPRETARVIAEMFGWRVEFDPNERDEAVPVKSGTRSRIAPKRKRVSKPPPPTKTAAKKTGTRRRIAR
jgi:hypothetical protein